VLSLDRNSQAWAQLDATLRDAATLVPHAGARALNRAALAGRTVAAREVAFALGVKQAALKPYLRMRRATPDHLESRIFALGRRGIPLIALDASGPEPSRGTGTGVTVKATPGRFPRAFIATMRRSGHRGVFERAGTARLPIRERFTRSLPHVLRQVRAAVVARATDALHTNLISELRYALRGRA
jgi:hypothetical protein